MDLRLEFMARLNRGERMTDLCVEYEISRKTGHKLKKRYEELGVKGLEDQSRAPKFIPHRTTPEIIELVVRERQAHPSWGPRKLKTILEERLGRGLPSASTLGDILVRAQLVERRKTRGRCRSHPTGLSIAEAPNDGWSIDYKGQFRLGDKSYCYPLTITDQYSRFILACDAMAAIDEEQARESCEMVFREYGLPSVIRSDNGVPFATTGLRNLSKLSVYWMRLGIRVERIRPAHPEENGRHERMHRTLKRETTRPPRHTLLQQQDAFENFLTEFNEQRPHEALDMKCPAAVYTKSPRLHPIALPDPEYPMHDDAIELDHKGRLYWCKGQQPYVAAALANQLVGIREEDDGRWLVTFMNLDLGYIETNGRFTAIASGVSRLQNV